MPLAVCSLSLLLLLDSLDLSFLHPRLDPKWESLLGKRIVLGGVVAEPVERRPVGARAIVDLSGTKIILTLPFRPDWERGDAIRFESRIKRPPRYQNPGGFNYRRYLERRGILLSGFVSGPEGGAVREPPLLVRKGRGSRLLIDRLRRQISDRLDETLPADQANFLKALLVGDRSGMEERLWEDFRRTGTAHLVAISGQHIGIVGFAFYLLFLWLLRRSERLLLTFSIRRVAALLALAPILFYLFLAGAPPSAVRATILAVLVVMAAWAKREADPWSALAAAAILIPFLDRSAPFSASFQLSFLAVMGLLWFRLGRGDPPEADAPTPVDKYLIRPFWMTFGATLLTAPLVAYRFHQLSLSGLLTNLWAIPFVGFLLIFAAAMLVLSLLLPSVLLLLGHVTGLFLFLLHLSSRLSWVASFYPTGFETVLAYLLVGGLILVRLKPRRWRPALAGGLLVLVLLFVPFDSLFSRRLEVTFLDVGEGDAALILTPSGESLLIDGGGFLVPGKGPPLFDVGAEVVVPYLKRRGLDRIDRVLLSHPHPDHYGGLPAILEEFPVGEFWWNGERFPDTTFDRLLQILDEKKVPRRLLKEGNRFDWGGLGVEVLYPPKVDPFKKINDNSLVVRLSFGEAHFLFPGDIEKRGEEQIQDSPGLRATVLKIPHHGSRTSSSVPFIDAVGPQFAVASLGEGNWFGFPHPGVLEKYERRGVTVFRTDRHGAVTITARRDFPRRPLSIRTFSSGR